MKIRKEAHHVPAGPTAIVSEDVTFVALSPTREHLEVLTRNPDVAKEGRTCEWTTPKA